MPVRQTNRRADLPAAGFPADILVDLDRSQRRGLRAQLERELRRAIQDGRAPAGTQLPASRVLARDLGIARSVVVEAYGHLVAEGYLEGRQGSGTRVRSVAGALAQGAHADAQPSPTMRFVGGLPDPAFFPRTEWQRHYRAALRTVPDSDLGYPGPQGALALRAALSNYTGRVRGVVTTPERMLITAGFTQALALLCRALKARGVDSMAVEDPCFGLHREVIRVAGLRAVAIPVDEHGIDVRQLADQAVGAVLIAPAHSYPTGAVLSAARRSALAAWARDRDALIIEDDYDAEFRYDRTPIGALQGLAPEHVVYAGCASKTLTPALRLGWIAAPAALIDDLVREKVFDDMGTALLEQLALARFIDTGGFTRHLRRVRPIYRARRDAALAAISSSLPESAATGVAAGLHVYVQLPTWCNERQLVDSAREHGVFVEGAAWHWADPESAPPALVLGYGTMREPAIQRGIEILNSIYTSLRNQYLADQRS
ncbi:MAG: MocR-like pyridoxine biosynthesis transcription factor PdxR [Solirubrobacteraceae bacterium]